MREPAHGTQEVIRTIERSEDGDVSGDRRVLIVAEQDENRHVLLEGAGCRDNCGSFLGPEGVAQDEQIKGARGEDFVGRVGTVAGTDIEASSH